MRKVTRTILGVALIILGVVAALTPFSPGSWLALVGLEILGLKMLLPHKLRSLLPRKYRDSVRSLSKENNEKSISPNEEIRMVFKKTVRKRKKERMSDLSFKTMTLFFYVIDFIYPYIDKRVKKFGIKPGMTVVDYGCGPGRYTTRFAKIVGEQGKVFAVDIHELAVGAVKKKIDKYGLQNVKAILADGYDSTLPDEIADVVCAIDMFHVIENPTEFMAELKRIIKKDGLLIIDDGHQSRSATKGAIMESGHWDILEETRDHLKCKPKFG